MLRTRRLVPGAYVAGSLNWTRGGEPSGAISYAAIMDEPGMERLILTYTRGSGADKESVRQEVRLVSTQPHYGGKRWWMICPYKGTRCAKLFLPGNGDRFASRAAWKVQYQSQRAAWHDKPFERLNRLQRKLGCPEGYEQWLRRPKGMWHRTYARHEALREVPRPMRPDHAGLVRNSLVRLGTQFVEPVILTWVRLSALSYLYSVTMPLLTLPLRSTFTSRPLAS